MNNERRFLVSYSFENPVCFNHSLEEFLEIMELAETQFQQLEQLALFKAAVVAFMSNPEVKPGDVISGFSETTGHYYSVLCFK